MEIKDLRKEVARGHRSRKKRRRRYRILRTFSKRTVFWFTVALGLAGAVLPYIQGTPWVAFSLFACLFIARVAYVNDKRGFSKRKSKDDQHQLNIYEALTLGGLILLLITSAAWVLIR